MYCIKHWISNAPFALLLSGVSQVDTEYECSFAGDRYGLILNQDEYKTLKNAIFYISVVTYQSL